MSELNAGCELKVFGEQLSGREVEGSGCLVLEAGFCACEGVGAGADGL